MDKKGVIVSESYLYMNPDLEHHGTTKHYTATEKVIHKHFNDTIESFIRKMARFIRK